MNSGSPGRSFIFKKSSRTTVVTAVTIAVLVLSGLDDLRVAVVTHRSDSATVWMVVVYVFSMAALLCWKHPLVQELLLLVGLVSSAIAGDIAFSIPLLVVLAFLASQHGLKRHCIPLIIGATVIAAMAAVYTERWVSIFWWHALLAQSASDSAPLSAGSITAANRPRNKLPTLFSRQRMPAKKNVNSLRPSSTTSLPRTSPSSPCWQVPYASTPPMRTSSRPPNRSKTRLELP